MFADQLEIHGHRIALLTDQGDSLSYLELAIRADGLFGAPGAPDRKPQPIVIECANTVQAVVAYLGALRRRIPVLLVDEQLPVDLRERLYRQFDIATVFSAGQWKPTGYGCHDQTAHPDLALMLSTSGSTGDPKLVKLTLANLHSNAASIAGFLGLTSEDRPITTLPLYYSYGLSVLNSHLLVGATVLLTGYSVASAPFWAFFKTQQATSLSGVPATYSMLRKMRFERMLLPSLRTMTQAGGGMSSDDTQWFAEHAVSKGQQFFVMYGQTEATARMAYVPPTRLLEKVGAIGVAIPQGSLGLVDESGGAITRARQQGELVYTGPNVMMGYATSAHDLVLPDQLRHTLRTGDLGWRDEDGYFYVTGRLKRFIKVFGNRIGLDEVESDLKQSGWDVAVTGHDDLLMVACQDANADLNALATHVSHRYRLHPSAIKTLWIDGFPLSSAGKLQYQELQRTFAASLPRT